MAAPLNLRVVDQTPPAEKLKPIVVDLSGDNAAVTIDDDGTARIEKADGSVQIIQDYKGNKAPDHGDFFRNLADDIDATELSRIASELIIDIEQDELSRREWIQTYAEGIKMLGFVLKKSRGEAGTSMAPLEGMSSVDHPLLAEAVIHFQAMARGELLPASGPVKIRNDLPPKPDSPPAMGHNGGPPLETPQLDDLATALEVDFNHYLTSTASEYVPDTDRMLFRVGLGGDGFKKVYNCPLRQRPVSESVNPEDFIVSNSATDLKGCGRKTHRIRMRRSTLRRMQLLGEYRDIKLGMPQRPASDAVDKAKEDISGQKPTTMERPQNSEYELYECYCELDLPDYAPKKFKNKELPLPYVVTLEKESQQILAIRRNWSPDDEQATEKQFFVQFPFILGLGFYGIGLIHVIGNITTALTALWRIQIDNGMFANFPGFLFAKGAGRQNKNQFRIAAGGGEPFDMPPGMDDIRKALMPLPYKETGAAMQNLTTHIEEVGQRLGQTADVGVGEGKQETPVGTIMAIIEQNTKIVDAVHKRLHTAQSQEFALLKERFKEDPEAFWRHNKKPARKWVVDEFKQALEENELVPVADPNNPTSLHRIAKATILDMLASKYPGLYNALAVNKRILRTANIDSDGLLNAQPAPPPPDPRFAAINAKSQAEQMKNQIEQAKLALKQQELQAKFKDDEAERQFKQQQQEVELRLEMLRLQAEQVIHAHDIARDDRAANQELQLNHARGMQDIIQGHASHQADLFQDHQQHQADIARQNQAHAADLARQTQQHQLDTGLEAARGGRQIAQEHDKHAHGLHREREKHEQAMRHLQEKHEADLAHTRAKAAAAAKAKPTGDKK